MPWSVEETGQMRFVTILTVVMLAGTSWCSISLFMSATKNSSGLRWYDRTIYFVGAILMAALTIGGVYLSA
jgi:hypothetical protein